MRPKRCVMCSKPSRQSPSKTCSDKCATEYKFRQRSLDRHRTRSKAPGKQRVTVEDWFSILSAHNNRCAYCGAGGKMTLDHVFPLSRGGRHCVGNIVPACGQCNHSKGALTVVEWRHTTKTQRHSIRQKLGHQFNSNNASPMVPWSINNRGKVTRFAGYSPKDSPIFEQMLVETNDRYILSRMHLTVDHYDPMV